MEVRAEGRNKYQLGLDPDKNAEYSSDEDISGIDLSNIESSDEENNEDDKELNFEATHEQVEPYSLTPESVPIHTNESQHTYASWEEVQAVLSESCNVPKTDDKAPTSPTSQRKIAKIAEVTYTQEELASFERIKERISERYQVLQENDEQIKIARTQLNLVTKRLENAEKNIAIIEAACKEHTEKAINEDDSKKNREIVAKLVNICDQLNEAISALKDAKNKFKTKFDFHNDILLQKITEQENYKEMSTKEKISRNNKAAKNSIIHPVQVIKAKAHASTNKSVVAKEYRENFANMKSASVKVERTLRKAAMDCKEVGLILQLNNPGYKLFDQPQKAETAAKVIERPSSPGPKL